MTSAASEKSAKSAVTNACKSFMRPLARFLVRNGIGFREFAEICKEAYVDVVSDDYGIRGRKTNVSRAAVLTGLTRKEVSKIRRSTAGKVSEYDAPIGRPAMVLDAWHHAEGFQSADGRPMDLTFDSGPISFRELSKVSGGDIPPRAMLKELIRAGSVIKMPDEKLRVVSRTFIPDTADPDSVQLAGQTIADLISTINHNLFSETSSGSILERRVYGENLSAQDARKFRRFAGVEAERLLEMLNDWISTQQAFGANDEENRSFRFGLGVYLFESDSENGKS